MKSWYRTIREDELKDGSVRKVYHLVFETDDKNIVEKVEQFFCDVMDAKTEPHIVGKHADAIIIDETRLTAKCLNCANGSSYKCSKCDGEMYYKYDKDEPQTDNGIGCSRCEGRFDCYDRDLPNAVHCNNYGKITDGKE